MRIVRKLAPHLPLLAVLSITGCADDKPPAILPDSAITTREVDSLQGKHMSVKRGPADILQDTTTNKRKPAFVRRKE